MSQPSPHETNAAPRRRGVGPGWIVAAAFIGPGTVTTATLAGARYGSALLWALAFSAAATMVLQEMAARLGLVTGQGLGEAVRRRFHGGARVLAVALVVGAIGLGNAAYQTGNLLGGALGVEGALGGDLRLWAALIGGVAAVLLWSGNYRIVERTMVALVLVMSAAFVVTALRVLPAVDAPLAGLLVPRLPDADAILVAVGLVGTTVVPYNLFLHATAVGERWSGPEGLGAARMDLVLSIGVGGLVSMAILVTAAGTLASSGTEVTSAADMARALEPILGPWAGVAFAVGLFAAGMTSAITAPLAAAYAVAGAVGWPADLRDRRLRAVWITVLGVGVLLAVLGIRPVPAIVFAQAANGILLPTIAAFLLLVVNDREWMGARANGLPANLLGGVVVLVATLLGLRALASVLGLWG
ncbi:MAG: Nramp family divalent metal transporter [Gemmatimonadetes bacterium]|nr:Nramp family divalent metal transporter [Gemmatimonadota bacterium]NNF38469.1 Nramp family divalent metal transporter [Gemmatimonadota bacterium]